jgi:DNA polymerase
MYLKYFNILTLIKKKLEEYLYWDENEIYISSNIKETNNFEINFKIDKLKKKILSCKRCCLYKNRLNVVFGSGSLTAKIMFVGEAPGYDEDHIGEPFVGKSGKLLTKIIEAIGQKREDVYITNIVKCHPMIEKLFPFNRANDRRPTIDEINSCKSYLNDQIEIIRPNIIVTLGSVSISGLLNIESPMYKIRGLIKEYKGIKVIPTYHPAALLRNPNLKKFVWFDMKKVLNLLKKYNK